MKLPKFCGDCGEELDMKYWNMDIISGHEGIVCESCRKLNWNYEIIVVKNNDK